MAEAGCDSIKLEGGAGANHNPTYAGTTTQGFVTDGINTVLFARGNGCTGTVWRSPPSSSRWARSSSRPTCRSTRYTWNTNGSAYDFQATCAHEVGHALGIHHTELTSTPRPTMYASYFGTDGRTLEADDASALQCAQSRYPLP